MLKRFFIILSLVFTLAGLGMAQNSNSSTTPSSSTRERTVAPKPAATPKPASTPKKTPTAPAEPQGTQATPRAAVGTPSGVLAAFNSLLEGIRHTNVDAVANAYWNSPRLVLFNNNGTITRGWEQMRQNRASSYAEMKDVKLDVRDLRVLMLGRDGAVVTCLWTQSQTFRGAPETATGRMTIVFRRVGKDWKAVHLHTSPDAPTPGRVLPSEQSTPAKTNP
jgi:ketosteroid isomerase-like protein